MFRPPGRGRERDHHAVLRAFQCVTVPKTWSQCQKRGPSRRVLADRESDGSIQRNHNSSRAIILLHITPKKSPPACHVMLNDVMYLWTDSSLTLSNRRCRPSAYEGLTGSANMYIITPPQKTRKYFSIFDKWQKGPSRNRTCWHRPLRNHKETS